MNICNDPDFNNLLLVLQREVPSRPTIFEFFLNDPLYAKLAGFSQEPSWNTIDWNRLVMKAFIRAGYDYFPLLASDFWFPAKDTNQLSSRSMNDTAIIVDRESYESYQWPNPDLCDYSRLDIIAEEIPEGAKAIVHGPNGVLENVMLLLGYEGLCMMMMDDPELVERIFEDVGSRLARYYELAASHPAVGALISNDDWGFNTQTMLSPADMRRYVFPWHERIVDIIHAAGKPAILHSCGNLAAVMDDIIDGIHYDGKHSYEDKICPVEDAYEKWGKRIAILGGIDVDFICRSTPDEISSRARKMLDRTADRGGYALGSGNSIPHYVPDENYFAMTLPATAKRRM